MRISLNMKKWIEGCIGEYKFVRKFKDLCATHNNVEFLTDLNGKIYCLKIYMDKRRWNTESFAYKYLLNFENEFIPKYYGNYCNGQEYAILLSYLNGEPLAVRINEITERDKELIYYNAGRTLLEIQSNSKRNSDGFGQVGKDKIGKYIVADKFFQLLDKTTVKIYKKAYDRIEELYHNEESVLVNEDNGIRNWIINSKNEFIGFIDFEYLSWGIKEQSLMSVILSEEHLRNAFFKGYGVNSEIQKSDKFLVYQVLVGISTLLFGKLNNNDKAIYIGNIIIDRYKKTKI